MPRNSSGIYSLPASNPVADGTTIEATWANDTMNDIKAEITNSLPRDGTAPMTAPLILQGNAVADLAAVPKQQLDAAVAAAAAAYQPIDADTAKLDVEQTWTAQQTPMNGSATATTTAAWDCDATGQVYDLLVGTTNNFTMNAPTNVLNRTCYILRVTQDATTARTITWNAAYKFPGGYDPALSTALGAVDIFTFIGGSGNVMHCVGVAKGLA